MSEIALTENNIIVWSMVAAALPALVYTLLIYWVDHFEREPWGLLVATFIWGAVPAVIISLVASTILSVPLYLLFRESTADFIAGGAIAPLVEETAKAAALILLFLFWRREIDSPLDGIIYGAMVGMGFAVVENVFYFVSAYQESGRDAWSTLIIVRAIIFGLNHALYTAMIGLGVALAWLSRNPAVRILAPLVGWAVAVALHSLHNVVVSLEGSLALFLSLFIDWGGVLLTLGIIAAALYQERVWMDRYLPEEVERGTLTAEHLSVARSARQRTAHRLSELFRGGPAAFRRAGRLNQRLSELAYRKRHLDRFGDDESARAVEQLRVDIARLLA